MGPNFTVRFPISNPASTNKMDFIKRLPFLRLIIESIKSSTENFSPFNRQVNTFPMKIEIASAIIQIRRQRIPTKNQPSINLYRKLMKITAWKAYPIKEVIFKEQITFISQMKKNNPVSIPSL